MSQKKESRLTRLIRSLPHRHHFSNPNTAEILFTLLFIGIIGQVLSFLGREAKY